MTSSMDGMAPGGTDSPARMITPMHLPQVLPVHVGVDLRGGDVDMAEHLLDGPEIRTPFEQVGGEGMAKGVWRHVLGNAGTLDVAAQDLPRAHAGERLAA